MNSHRSTSIGLCLAALMAVTLYVGLSQHPGSFDDAYITYRYARNIARGRGFVYNPGEPILGTTTPLYALLLAGLSHLWGSIPLLSYVVGVVAWTLCVLVLYGIARSDGGWIAGLASASLVATNALFLNVLGMETTPYVLVSLLAFYFFLEESVVASALCAGLAFLVRWDGILVVAVIILAQALRDRRQFLVTVAVCSCLIVPWLAYSQLRFGSVFPNTFFAKAGQGWNAGLGATEIGPFPRGVKAIASAAQHENALFVVCLGLAVVGTYWALRRRAAWWPVMLWTVSYFAGYTVLGVLQFPWYYPPLIPAVSLLIGLGIEGLVESLPQRHRWLRLGLTAVLVAVCVVPSVDWLMANRRSSRGNHLSTYVEVGEWLRDHTPRGSSVAAVEIGAIGFYSERTIVDTMGLVSPEMVGHLDTWLQTLQFAINHYWPDYAVTLENTAWGGVVSTPWFEEAYALDKTVENPDDPVAPVRIYRRRAGFPLDEFALIARKDIRFDEVFALRRFEIAEKQAESSGRLHARLTWEALADVRANHHIRFDLVSATDGRRMTLRSGAEPMRGGNPTRLWSQGDRISDHYTLQIPESVRAGPHLLQLLVSGGAGGLSVTDSNGDVVDYIVVGPIEIHDGGADVESPPSDASAVLSDNISLLGYDWTSLDGNDFEVDLYWQARGDISQDYTVFVHVVSPEERLVAQHDSLPALPTRLWVPGIPVVDSHSLSLPTDVQPGEYEVRIGMYHWPDLTRLPVVRSNEVKVTHDTVVLREVSIE